jgi:NAD(P)H-flavin reductase
MAPDRPTPPFGRRAVEVREAAADGGYRIFTLVDREGPEPLPGQFYMLCEAPEWSSTEGRPYLPRAISYARSTGREGELLLEFLIDDVGPGTKRLARLEKGDGCWITGPFGNPFSAPRELAAAPAGAILVGGGIGIAPLAALRRSLISKGFPTRTLLGFRDLEHSGAVESLFGCEEVRLAFEDGSSGHHGYVTDLLELLLERDDPGGAVVYSCGPPAMLEAVKKICGSAGVPAELALESPMACGFGACFGCAVPRADGNGYLRLCIDGPVVRSEEIATALVGESG